MNQPETKTAPKSAFTVKETCYAGLFAAVIAIMAQISIPMPGGVPMTMQTFAVTLAAIVLGAKLSTVSTVIYLILGAAGVPVLAGFTGGLAKFVGPTGGFLISFPLMAFVIGWGVEHRRAFPGAFVVALVAGTVLNYVVGVAMFCALTQSTLAAGITACVLPFIPTAIIKAILASVVGFAVRKRLNYIQEQPFLRLMQEGLFFACRYALKSAACGFSRRHGERNGLIPTAAVKLATGLDFKRRYGIIN